VTAPARPVLTASELTLIERLAAGDTYERIAKDLGVQRRTLRKRAERAFHKLGAVNMPNAVILACRAGLIDGRPQGHGDHNGYETHVRRRTEICGPCREGEKTYRAGLKARQKAAGAPEAPQSLGARDGPPEARTAPQPSTTARSHPDAA